MDNLANGSEGFSVSGVPVVISHLATTQKALQLAESSELAFPLPGLNDIQMDGFIDVGNRMCNLGGLKPKEVSLKYLYL